MSTILIIDDDDQLRTSFDKLLHVEGYSVLTAPSGEAGLDLIKNHNPDLVILDIRLPGLNGLETFERIRKIDTKLPVIVMTAFGTTETAIEATKLGAFDYILKPFDIPDILKLIKQAQEAGRFMRSQVTMNSDPQTALDDVIIGKSEQMQNVYKAIGRVALTDATVLIRGETGTGKELVARALYQHSMRVNKSFRIINCVAIPDTLLESELFGYEKGAFTGAVNRRIGKIEQAHNGTVLLDEIGDMPLNIQAKILRLLEERSVERLGGHQAIPIDVRIIAATNRDLEKAIIAGSFREDLYYRLSVVTINLPPLRERVADIELLSAYFLTRFSKEMNRDNPGLTPEALELLKSHNWPGNVRELANVIKKALIFSRGYPFRAEDINLSLNEGAELLADQDVTIDEGIRKWVLNMLRSNENDLFNTLMDKFTVILICEVLKISGGNRSQAAKMLGISRPTLLAKIDKYHLHFETSVKSD
ncbi:sigma-54-dependent transcriptional regulator [candidate division CSSED10-310 bacterium]|uniref:DNA-binding transcriptional regulator NtrC n=1 Tax=candidate division CSSED10-310 bacterium TaxID=2855610 RepID=A0ABV6Z4Z8_UNCC1